MTELMKPLARIVAAVVLCVGLGLIALDFFGEHRVFGYEQQIDTKSAKTRRIEYFCFFRRTVVIETNEVARIAETIRPNGTQQWEFAVRRPALRRKSEELDGAILLNEVKTMSAFLLLPESNLNENERKNLVSQLLEMMGTKSAREVRKWVDAQTTMPVKKGGLQPGSLHRFLFGNQP